MRAKDFIGNSGVFKVIFYQRGKLFVSQNIKAAYTSN